jgi:hypothetical protein
VKKETVKINKAALCFSNVGSLITLSAKEEGKQRSIAMTLYSGKLIKGHWYWGDLAIDTAGIKMAKKNIPILEDHDTSKKIGFGSFATNEKHELVAVENTFVDTSFANEFQRLSDQGFPYEASLSGRPTKIQRLMEKEEAEVNGFTMKGPGTIWRESVIREGSICTFGYDPHTKSVAMTENEEFDMEVNETLLKDKEVVMDLIKLKAEHPALYEEVISLGVKQAEIVFAPVKAGLETQVTSLTAERDTLKQTNAGSEERLLKLEKISALQAEAAIGLKADGIVTVKLSGSKVPKRLHAKVRKQLSHQPFVKDNVLDEVAFSAAVDTELKDWASEESTDNSESHVLGMSFLKTGDGELSDKSAEDIVNRMLKSTGQTVQ